MLIVLVFVIGALIGWRRAGERGGDTRDRLQYATAYGIAFALVALTLAILAERFGVRCALFPRLAEAIACPE